MIFGKDFGAWVIFSPKTVGKGGKWATTGKGAYCIWTVLFNFFVAILLSTGFQV